MYFWQRFAISLHCPTWPKLAPAHFLKENHLQDGLVPFWLPLSDRSWGSEVILGYEEHLSYSVSIYPIQQACFNRETHKLRRKTRPSKGMDHHGEI